MNPLDWATIAGLILQYGLPFVEKLIAKWSNNTPVTPAEWADLMSASLQTASSQMKAALARAGIPETDQRYIDLMKAVNAI